MVRSLLLIVIKTDFFQFSSKLVIPVSRRAEKTCERKMYPEPSVPETDALSTELQTRASTYFTLP